MYRNKGKDKKQRAVMKQSFVLCILINVKREVQTMTENLIAKLFKSKSSLILG